MNQYNSKISQLYVFVFHIFKRVLQFLGFIYFFMRLCYICVREFYIFGGSFSDGIGSVVQRHILLGLCRIFFKNVPLVQ